jgi:hypothetical protein
MTRAGTPSRWQIMMKVLVALALPDIYNSLRHLFGMAFGYIMLAELINASYGLGFLLMTRKRRGPSGFHPDSHGRRAARLAIDRLLTSSARSVSYRPADGRRSRTSSSFNVYGCRPPSFEM